MNRVLSRDDGQSALMQSRRANQYLAERKWKDLCEDLLDGTPADREKAGVVARLMENNRHWIRNVLSEDVRTLNVGTFNRFVFPIIRAAYANLVSMDLFSVQPMQGPTSLIFYLDTLYGKTKGSAQAGQIALGAVDGHEPAIGYPSELIDFESIGSIANGSATTFNGTLKWTPMRPATVVVSLSTATSPLVQGQDDGVGNITGNGIASGTVNYTTGAVSVTFSAAPASGTVVRATYRYVMEGNSLRPSMDIILTSQLVKADTWSLETNWSVESEQDFRAVHGIEADATLMAKVAEQLRYEIDRDNISQVDRVATSTATAVWDFTPPPGVDYFRHQLTFINTLIAAGNDMFYRTRGQYDGNWLVCGVDVASVIEALPQFSKVDYTGTKGVVYIGQLGRWKCYKDPWLTRQDAIMGHKGTDWTEAGYVFAPYVPLWRTPIITLTDQVRRVGLQSRFARKLINPKVFLKVRVLNFGQLT